MGKKSIMTVVILLAIIAAINAPQKYLPITTYIESTNPLNTEWSGISDFKNYLETVYKENRWGVKVNVILLDNFSKMNLKASRRYNNLFLRDVLVIIGPDIPFNEKETDIIREFIENGGSVLIADELGIVNNILKTLFRTEISNISVTSYLSLVNRGYEVDWYANFTYPIKVTNLKIDLPSYLTKLGVLKPAGYYVDSISNKNIKYIYAGYTVIGKSRIYVIADTSIFINRYFSEQSENSYLIKNFVIALFNWLSGLNNYNRYGGEIRIYIDCGHYMPISINMPLPHIGKIIANYLEYYGSEINKYFYSYVIGAPTLLKLAMVILIAFSIYRVARGWYVGRIIRDLPMESIIEQRILVFSPEYEKMRIHITRRGIYKQLIGKLYELTNIILKKKLNLTIEDLVLKDKGWDIIPIYLDRKDDVKKLRKVMYDLYKIKEYLEGKRRLIFVFMWKRKFNRYITVLDQLFKKLGFELIGD